MNCSLLKDSKKTTAIVKHLLYIDIFVDVGLFSSGKNPMAFGCTIQILSGGRTDLYKNTMRTGFALIQ